MSKEIIINANKSQTCIAILEDGDLVELYMESPENIRTIGDIYLGRVRKVMPSIQAAFVDIGQKQDAFLHFSDVSENLKELIDFVENPGRLSNQPATSIAGEDDEDEADEDAPASDGQKQRNPQGRQRRRGGRRRGRGRNRSQQSGDGEASAQSDPSHTNNGSAGETSADSVTEGRSNDNANRARQQRSKSSRGRGRSKDDSSRDDRGDKPGDDQQSERGGGDSSGGGYTAFAAESETEASSKFVDAPTVDPIQHLQRDQKILVQITKEPISNKGSRVTSGVTLAGRFMVLVPMASYVAVSKKIYSTKERRRLRALAKSLLPEGFGIIVRTVAEGKNAKTLDTDLRLLLEKWRRIEDKLVKKPEPPVVIHQDVNMVSSVIRDLFTDDYDRILIDDQRVYRNIKSYVQAVAPQMAPAVKLHEGPNSIFDTVGIARQTAEVFESRIDLPSGGYLFIEKTEAMYVIDVNSGRSGRGRTQEENSLKVNMEAARVITRHLRLRDLGGIIVVDFIDLREEANRRKVYDELRRLFRKDRAVTKILPMSDFGLIQITRQRLRPSISYGTAPEEIDSEAYRSESGLAPSVKDVLERLERWILLFHEKTKKRTVTLRLHPFTSSFLTKGVPNYPMRWLMRYFVRVKLETDERLDPLEFRFLDSSSGAELTDEFDHGKI